MFFKYNNIMLVLVYNIVIRHFYNLCGDHPVSVAPTWHHTSYYTITMFPLLYFTSPWLFCNYQFVLLIPFTFSIQPPTSSHSATVTLFSISMRLFLFCFLYFLDSTCKWNHMVLSFSMWFVSPIIRPSRSIHVFAIARSHSLLWLSNTNVLHLLYPLVYW